MSSFKHLLLAGAIAGSAPLLATDFGVMETAEPIARGHFKFIGYPLVVRNQLHREQGNGVAVGLGFGLSDRLDVEAQIANYDDITLYGADLEGTFFNAERLDMSVAAGSHYAVHDFGQTVGYDLTYVASYDVRGAGGVVLYGALDAAYEDAELDRQPGGLREGSYTELHAVPGLEFRINRNVDLIGEIGVGLDDDAADYAAVGVSFYFR